jgi:sugar phosphate isomerase/epimerase
MITRRELLKTAASAAVASPLLARPSMAAAAQAGVTPALPNPRGPLGLGASAAGFGTRRRVNAAATPPVDWVDYLYRMGYGGAETREPPTDPAEIAALRKKLDTYHMRIVFDFALPKTDADLPRYEALVKAAKDAGAVGLRAALTQRRYEAFDTFEAFKASFEENKTMVARAEPVLRKHKIVLALENHKGWRSAEQAAWLNGLGSEYVGVLLDFGNNISLCEDPMETLDTLLPLVRMCHIKDMAVAPYEDGFLLSEVPLGEGFLDLRAMVAKLRQQDPDMPFDLEMITRDPLKIPIFTDKYWATFDDRFSPLPGRDVAHILKVVRDNPPKAPLPKTTGLSPEAHLALEDRNNQRSLEWARQHLNL